MKVWRIKQKPIDPEKFVFLVLGKKFTKKKKPHTVTIIEGIDVYVIGENLYNPIEEKRTLEKNLRNGCEKRKRRWNGEREEKERKSVYVTFCIVYEVNVSSFFLSFS